MSSARIIHPGIIFPDTVENSELCLHKRKHNRRPRSQKIEYDISFDWGVTSSQIASKYGLSIASVRQYLHRHKVEYKLIRQAMTGPAVIFWNREEALSLFKGFPQKFDTIPDGYISAEEAQKILAVKNTTLLRMVTNYRIPSKLIRLTSDGKNRHRRVYNREAIVSIINLFTTSNFGASPN